jgi:hypothetical protein
VIGSPPRIVGSRILSGAGSIGSPVETSSLRVNAWVQIVAGTEALSPEYSSPSRITSTVTASPSSVSPSSASAFATAAVTATRCSSSRGKFLACMSMSRVGRRRPWAASSTPPLSTKSCRNGVVESRARNRSSA